MRERLLNLVVCPECRGSLDLKAEETGDYGIKKGILKCSCGGEYPIIDYVPRFVDSDLYVSSFSFQWTLHKKTQLDNDIKKSSEEAFEVKTGFTPEELKGKVVLDVGVGMGRYLDVAQRWGKEGDYIGIDLSRAVESAQENIGDRENVHIIQADLFKPPFRKKTFDFIYSIGVLHHTPDCKSAFQNLVPYLNEDGKIAIYVYDNRCSGHRFSDFYRKVTTRIPDRALYALCFISVPWYYACKLPVVGLRFAKVLPICHDPDWKERVLGTFDWYSPRYQSKHGEEEVMGWFEESGLVDVTKHNFAVSVSGRKPSEGG